MRKSVSVAFGIFMGIVPIWGFQLVAAIAGAYLLRLNKALVIIFANISIPPNIPLILFLSYQCGKVWMGENAVSPSFTTDISLETLHRNAVQYFYGAVTLSILSAFLFGLVAFFTLKTKKYFE